MADILDKLKEWEARLAEMDRGEFDNGIMASIRFEQRDMLDKAMAEIARLRQASLEAVVPAWSSPENLPGTRAIFLVRKWVSKSGNAALSFVAKNPDEHLRAFGFAAEFDPDVAVVAGFVQDGEFHDENGFVDESFDLSAVLAWTPIPQEYLREAEAAAQKTSELLAKVTKYETGFTTEEHDCCAEDLQEAKNDSERLEWLMQNVSGAEFRRLGVTYGGNCGRDRIDAAMMKHNK